MYFFSGKAFACCSDEDHDGPEIEVTYESALLATYSKGSGRRKLAGTPTYRMPHHPRYKDWFENPMYKPVWFKAFGRLRYTQLVRMPTPAAQRTDGQTPCLCPSESWVVMNNGAGTALIALLGGVLSAQLRMLQHLMK